ncbi:hypothetical protein F5890DRAFT_568479 [Lentinula detonsa]|uniref:Uncharacterized protein n=1 Tax=Lentinula detonsa TaxID=2804962 RepID=A0AA38PT00_9AGAR|nr:hypothetical protein F5890DRAFT_568479 [Lentinula detonsa]
MLLRLPSRCYWFLHTVLMTNALRPKISIPSCMHSQISPASTSSSSKFKEKNYLILRHHPTVTSVIRTAPKHKLCFSLHTSFALGPVLSVDALFDMKHHRSTI